jgi:hypothetical protein
MTVVTMSERRWNCHRFQANLEDPRPMTFPPPGPYWITGEGEDYAIVVAYLPPDKHPSDPQFWPEAAEIEFEP